jgi:hypothetical protein
MDILLTSVDLERIKSYVNSLAAHEDRMVADYDVGSSSGDHAGALGDVLKKRRPSMLSASFLKSLLAKLPSAASVNGM